MGCTSIYCRHHHLPTASVREHGSLVPGMCCKIIIQAFNDCCKHANHGLPADKDLLVEICSSHTTAAGAAAGEVPGAVAVAVTNLLSFLQKPSNTMLREILRHAKILILLYKQLA